MSENTGKKITIILAILLVILVAFFFIMYERAKKESMIYTGITGERYEFQKRILGGNTTFYYIYLTANGRGYSYPFRYYPKELEDIPLDVNINNDLFTKKLIFATQNLETTNKTQQQSFLGMMEVVRILGMADEGIYQLAVKSAFIEDYNNNAIASCGDVGKNTGVMYFKLGEENRIYTDNGCIVIEGKDAEGLMKSSEKFAYHLLKVF